VAVMYEEAGATEALRCNFEERQVKTENLHTGDAAAPVTFNRYVEFRPILGCFNNEAASPVVIEFCNCFSDDKDCSIEDELTVVKVFLKPTFQITTINIKLS